MAGLGNRHGPVIVADAMAAHRQVEQLLAGMLPGRFVVRPASWPAAFASVSVPCGTARTA